MNYDYMVWYQGSLYYINDIADKVGITCRWLRSRYRVLTKKYGPYEEWDKDLQELLLAPRSTYASKRRQAAICLPRAIPMKHCYGCGEVKRNFHEYRGVEICTDCLERAKADDVIRAIFTYVHPVRKQWRGYI